MAKTKSNRRKQRGGGGNWSSGDHDARTAKRLASLNKKRRRQERRREEAEAAAEAEEGHDHQHQPPVDEPPTKTAKPSPPHEPPLHQLRPTKRPGHRPRLSQHVPANAYKRSHLAHDNYDQIDASKLRLATSQLQRKADALRERLERWDPVEEEARRLQLQKDGGEDRSSVEYQMKLDAEHSLDDRNARQKARGEYYLLHAQHGVNSSAHRRKANLKKKPRPGPESWKLRGAARPAWEVYDFDTRYVDRHAKAMEEANDKARRSRNVLALCRGRFALDGGEDEDDGAQQSSGNDTQQQQKQTPFPPPQPYCREYLSLLTQLGSLHLARKNYSSARKSLLEAIELEGPRWPNSVTNARAQLMNMCLSTNRPAAARKLWTALETDQSAWIRYAAALVEYVSWNVLQEEGSTARSAERTLARAIRGNVYVAYYLGWPETFRKAMEYTDEVAEQGMDSPGGSILEAIEYGCGWYSQDVDADEDAERGMAVWLGTEGSLEWVRSVVLKVLTNSSDDVALDEDPERLTKVDLQGWEAKLRAEEEAFERERVAKEARANEYRRSDGELDDAREIDEEELEEEPDVVMYGGMFRTAMDWLTDAGDFLKEPSFEYVNEFAGDDAPNNTEEAKEESEDKAEEAKDKSNDEDDGSTSGSDSGESDGDSSGQVRIDMK